MKVKEVFEKSVQFLRERNIESPRLEAELLVSSVLKTDRVGIYLKYEAPLTEIELSQLRELVVRKSKGEPTAYLLGEKYFFGRRFHVGPGVLIPRPETELIVEDVISYFRENLVRIPARIADLGAGSGCLGLTLGLEFPQSQVALVERSLQAFEFCRKNLETVIEEPQRSRFQIFHQDVENWQASDAFDLVVANPPYIDPADENVSSMVRKYEPNEALFSDDHGLADIKSWLLKLGEILSPKGITYFEIGHKQGPDVKKLFESQNIFKAVEILQDFNKKDRIIKAVKNG
jgi:release factor glutamine methyltransferase